MNARSWLRLHWPLIALLALSASSVAWAISGDWLSRLALAWDIGVGLLLIESGFKLIRARSTADIRRRAAALDDAGPAVLPLAVLAALASVGVVVGVALRASSGGDTGAAAVLALTTVALSWLFVHTMFAFHYAHAYYTLAGKTDRGGLIFPGGEPPDYWDFLHFSLIIGVASQTADVQISDKALRRASTVHSLTSFLFNTVIVALTVNMAVSLLGAG